MNTIRRREALQWTMGAACALALPAARAQAQPETARIFVGFPPGGAPDFFARRLAEELNGKLAKTVLVENKPGAGGRIAIDSSRQAPPDGTTLLLNPAGVLSINPHSYRKLSYDPFKDFAPLSLAATVDFGFGVGPAVPANVSNVAEFAAWAKANKGKVSYGSPAAGSPPHFVGDALSRKLDLDMTHVPYRGGGAALNDLMGGQIAALVLTLGDMITHAKAGRLRLLASTGPARSRFAPELATFEQQGMPGLEMRDWFGVYIPGAPPAEVVARTAAIVRAAVAAPGYVEALRIANYEAAASTPQELEKLARSDLDRWAPIVKASGFQADV
ncbi:MAG TPA: tripartite tricarboxylate transporter substrate-binding protein [Methylibium sp.]|uniref:tripartite tricarboxylate transporter substrate-binding protein n=1 Tax=Methylibium sp. TaxID=2067992 RepID=UPI002DB89F3E|nr:tripartite tricarboxylate transporter substrate-binding protein [Methylibium sp.]HEU4459653.1 tripartite tricarboxylate transporter substrate-binding protein [Methylibium sp.]